MAVQPVVHDLTAPTQMQPAMPVVGEVPEAPPAKKPPPTRTEAVRAAKAKIMRRNSLRKQREAQKHD